MESSLVKFSSEYFLASLQICLILESILTSFILFFKDDCCRRYSKCEFQIEIEEHDLFLFGTGFN